MLNTCNQVLLVYWLHVISSFAVHRFNYTHKFCHESVLLKHRRICLILLQEAELYVQERRSFVDHHVAPEVLSCNRPRSAFNPFGINLVTSFPV